MATKITIKGWRSVRTPKNVFLREQEYVIAHRIKSKQTLLVKNYCIYTQH